MINQDLQTFQTLETNPKAGFRVLSIGGVPFVQPTTPPMVLTTDQLAALRSAARVAELGRRRVAEAIVGHVQRELGVSPDLHAQAIGAAADKVARIQRDQRARRVGQVRRQVITANRTVAAPAPTPEVQKALQSVGEALDRLRATRQTARNAREALVRSKALSPTERAELAEHANRARTANWAALALMRERSIAAEQLRRAQLDAFWAQTAEAETAELAQARGEVIGASRDAESSRALRISSRDGLATLFEAGAITAHQYGAGRAYRVAFEAAGVIRVASLNPDGPAGGRAQPSGLQARSAHELQRAYVLARLRQIELAVSGLGDRELNVLRKVAGEARTIRELGGGGNTREANQAALRRALEAAVRVLAGPVHLGLKRAAGR